MTKFVGQKNGRPLLGFGLSDANIEKLRQGLPIVVDMAKLVPELDFQVVIFWGKTELTMYQEFKERGVLGPDTVMNLDPDLFHPTDTPAEET